MSSKVKEGQTGRSASLQQQLETTQEENLTKLEAMIAQSGRNGAGATANKSLGPSYLQAEGKGNKEMRV